jgi:predicted phage terminase large subunit-like protein
MRACRILRAHIAGTVRLEPSDVQTYVQIVRKASAKSLYFFAKCVLGFDKMLPNPHRRWADDLQANFWTEDRFARLKPRGTYKTTLYGEAFILWVWATVSPKIRFLYTSANQALLDEVSAHLNHYIGEGSDSLYAFVFGITRDPECKNTEVAVNIIGRDESAKGFSLSFRTAGGSTNGVHPNVIIVDDPCDKDDRESRAVREAKKRWFDTLTPLLVPIDVTVPDGQGLAKVIPLKKTMLIATRWHLDDVIAYVQSKEGWHFEVEGVYDQHGRPMYPDLMPEAKIQEIKRQISEIFFACQYLNSPLPEGSRIFTLDRLHYVRPEQFNTKLGTNLAFFDPSQGKDGSDYPAFILVNVNERRIVFGAIDTKMDLTATIGVGAKLCLEHNVRTFVVETNGAMGIETTIANALNAVGHSCVIEPIHETRNKVERISMCQPELYSGQVLFCTDHKDRYPTLMTQLEFFPAWSHDDFPDVIEKAVTWLGRNAPVSFSRGGGGKSTVSASKTMSGSLSRRA